MTTQVPIGFCVLVLGLGLSQCEWTINVNKLQDSYLILYFVMLQDFWWHVRKRNFFSFVVIGSGCAGLEESIVIVPCSEFHTIENSNEFSHSYCSHIVGVIVYCSNLIKIDISM